MDPYNFDSIDQIALASGVSQKIFDLKQGQNLIVRNLSDPTDDNITIRLNIQKRSNDDNVPPVDAESGKGVPIKAGEMFSLTDLCVTVTAIADGDTSISLNSF